MGEGLIVIRPKDQVQGGSWGKGQPSQLGATSQLRGKQPQQGQGTTKMNIPSQCWQFGGGGAFKRDYPTLKGKELFQGGNV